jgi:hypothetical protein
MFGQKTRTAIYLSICQKIYPTHTNMQTFAERGMPSAFSLWWKASDFTPKGIFLNL